MWLGLWLTKRLCWDGRVQWIPPSRANDLSSNVCAVLPAASETSEPDHVGNIIITSPPVLAGPILTSSVDFDTFLPPRTLGRRHSQTQACSGREHVPALLLLSGTLRLDWGNDDGDWICAPASKEAPLPTSTFCFSSPATYLYLPT